MATNSKTRARESNPPSLKSTTTWSYYFIALAPIPLLFLASHFLRNIITSPPSDYGTGSMFDLIAHRYDFINRALALNLDMSWRKRLVKEVVGEAGEIFGIGTQTSESVKILDLATGTADVAILLGKAVDNYYNSHSTTKAPSQTINTVEHKKVNTILGLDPSQNMLNVGISKIQQSNLSHIVSLQLGDARNLSSLASDTFDAATMSFGIRNIPEKEKALCEIHRVLKKNGNESKLAIMEFSEPGLDSGIMGSMARVFIRHVVPAMGALLSGCPKEYMHLQKSIKDFPSPPAFVALMEGLRCPMKRSGSDENDEVMLNSSDLMGSFRVKEVINLNFGSVQIFIATPIMKKYVTE